MDLLTKSPGLHHVAESIFVNLDHEVLLLKCQEVNGHWRSIVRNPWFWFQKCEQKYQIKEKSDGEFIRKFLQEFDSSDLDEITVELMNICASSNTLQEPIDKFIHGFAYKKFIAAIENGMVERVKILAPLFDNPNAEAIFSYSRFIGGRQCTPIEHAAEYGLVDILKILIDLTDDPLKTKCLGPIYRAIIRGHTEVVKILTTLIDTPNALNEITSSRGRTPIFIAANNGHTEIVRILAPLTGTPNAPDQEGKTPILAATESGHIEIVRILAPISGTPNDPNQEGETPIHVASRFGHIKIVKILSSLADNLNTRNSNGFTPILLAAQGGHSEVVRILTHILSKPQKKFSYPNFLQTFWCGYLEPFSKSNTQKTPIPEDGSEEIE